jgi:hypothetical protein
MPFDAIKAKVDLMKYVERRKAGAVFGLIILFALLAIQFSSDPCPLHDRPAAHARGSGVSCKGLMCLCFPRAFCAPADSWLLEPSQEAAALREFSEGRVCRLFFLEVYHPPRASFLS